MTPRTEKRLLWAVVLVAFLLRLLRAGLRWDEIALAYAAYQQPFVDVFTAFDLGGMATTFYGLHPPGYALFFAVLDSMGASMGGILLFSVLVSTGAVWAVGRMAGPGAAAVLAVDPLQLAYAGEVNNYPLMVLVIAMLLWETERTLRQPDRKWFLLWGVLAIWTHFLAGVVLAFCCVRLLLRHRREAVILTGILALAALPVLIRMLDLSGQGGTYGQQDFGWDEVWVGLESKIAWWWLLIVPAFFGALRVRRSLGWVCLGLLSCILVMIHLRIAASHQQPYWLALGPFLAILVASNPGPLAWVMAALGLWSFLPPELERLESVQADLERERAVDVALAKAGSKDAIWLLSPALQTDDDKTATSDVLWRFSPWSMKGAWRGGTPGFEYADWQYGQPRKYGKRVVHSSVEIDWGPLDDPPEGQSGCYRPVSDTQAFEKSVRWHLEAGRKVWVVLYDHEPACGLSESIDKATEPFVLMDISPSDPNDDCLWVGEDRGLGRDRLCVIEGVRP